MVDTEEIQGALNGDYWELYQVVEEDDGAGGTVTNRYLVAATLAGFNLGEDSEEWELNPSTGSVIQQFWGKRSHEGEMTAAYAAGMPTLMDMGLLDETDGHPLYNEAWEMAECWVYPEEPGGPANPDPQSIIEMPAFRPKIDDYDLQSGDAGEINITFKVNSRPRFPLAVGEAVPTV